MTQPQIELKKKSNFFLDCECKREGTEVCDHTNGDCTCLEGVEGIRCDRCMSDHWGFDLSDRVSTISFRCVSQKVILAFDRENYL